MHTLTIALGPLYMVIPIVVSEEHACARPLWKQ